jgi:hypothetical protein
MSKTVNAEINTNVTFPLLVDDDLFPIVPQDAPFNDGAHMLWFELHGVRGHWWVIVQQGRIEKAWSHIEHKTTFMHELNNGQGADIDIEVMPVVKYINKLGMTTISSCQGWPGLLAEGGHRGHVYFTDGSGSYENLANFAFNILRPMFAHLWDDVCLGIFLSEDIGFYVDLSFRNEAIPEITKRLGCYCEILHK